MRELNFTEEELKNAIKGNYVASGSEASVYKYKKYIAIRLYDIEENIYCPLSGNILGKPLCESMIKNLHVYKDNIKLSSFPLGVVKVNGVVVRQLIKYYNNSISLTDFFKSSPSVDPIPYFLKCLDILEELALHNICYEDVHGGNFLIVGNKLRLVDYSDHRIKINQDYPGLYYNMFQNFNPMVNSLSFRILHLDDEYNRLMIPSEIKNEISASNLKESFDYVRNLVLNMKKDINTKKR